MTQARDNLSAFIAQQLDPEQGELLRTIAEAAAGLQCPAYLVGGPVRDLLLQRRQVDIDIVVEGDGPHFAMALAESLEAKCTIHEPFLTAALELPDGSALHVATARSESYERPGALPKVQPASLAEDLGRRDFSINAMALSLNPQDFADLYDPYGGCDDLSEGLLRVLHQRSFLDDPTRIIRGLGFQVRMGLCFEAETQAWLQEAVRQGALDTVSPHRIGEALMPLLANDVAVDVLLQADQLGVLGALDLTTEPLAEPVRAALQAAGAALEAIGLPPQGELAALTYLAILSQGEPLAARRITEALHLNKQQARLLDNATRYLAQPPEMLADPQPPASSLFFALEGAGIPALASLWGLERNRRANIERFWLQLRSVKADVSGDDLIEAGAEPSPHFAAALRAALAHKLDHPDADRAAQLRAALQALDR